MPAVPLGSALFLLVLTTTDLQIPGWSELTLAERQQQVQAAWEEGESSWITVLDGERRVARYDGAMLVLFADLAQSAVDRELTMKTNTHVDVDRPVALLEMPSPHYPVEARDRGVHGYVQLRCRVDARGQVDLIVVPPGEEVALLTDAAIDAVHQARFRPAERKGERIATWKLIPFEFVLEDAPARLAR